MNANIVIVGAGIIGITNAIALLKQGFQVTILTKDDPLATNSDAAVAIWYGADHSRPISRKLCLDSLPEFYKLSQTPNSGVSIIPVVNYFNDEEDFNASIWSDRALQQPLAITDISANPPTGVVQPTEFSKIILAHIPLADVLIYRPFLLELFKTLGGKLKLATVTDLTALFEQYDIVVNSAGWEAGYLTNDSKIYPIRGQTEIAPINTMPTQSYSINIHGSYGYAILRPQSKDCVIGSTYQINDTHRTPREEDKQTILAQMSRLIPEMKSLHTTSKVGIRCGREDDVRIESESISVGNNKTSLLIHCYGHGGSGFSGSWGSANNVVDFVVG